jgi:hypothetical protein
MTGKATPSLRDEVDKARQSAVSAIASATDTASLRKVAAELAN